MSKERTATASFFQELLNLSIYKGNQGRLARRITCLAMWIVAFLAAWRLNQMLINSTMPHADILFPGLLLAAGLWIGFRVVNIPQFAEFLIAVEAEMNKVSWPSRAELVRSSLVVIFVIVSLTLVLYGLDIVWSLIFQRLGIMRY